MFGTHREETKGGKDWLVVNGVAVVEGVLKRYFVPMDEIGRFAHDWNGVPVVLRHPVENGGSAKTPDVDVPVLGTFYQAAMDTEHRRLTGEFWLDKAVLLASDEGKQIMDAVTHNRMMEVSTGYFAGIEQKAGNHKGKSYLGIHRNIHPDHIAILPDVPGACSVSDGCGLNRNDAITDAAGSMFINCGECPAKKHVHQADEEGDEMLIVHLKGDGESLTQRISAIRDAFQVGRSAAAKLGGQPMDMWLTEIFDDHVIVEMNGAFQSASFSTDGKGVITFEAPNKWTTVKRDIKFVPVANMLGDAPAGMKTQWEKVFKKAKADGKSEEEAAKMAWGACKAAGWTQGKGGKWMMKNAMISVDDMMTEDEMKGGMVGGKGKGGRAAGMKKKLADLMKGKSKQNDSSGDQEAAVSDSAGVRHNNYKETRPMNRKFLTGLLKSLGYEPVFNDESDENEVELSALTPGSKETPALPDDLVALAAYLKEAGGVSALKTAITNASEAQVLRESLGDSGELKTLLTDIKGLLVGVRNQEDSEKVSLIAQLNDATDAFTEEEYKAMPIAQLRKFAHALTGVNVDYGVLGGVKTHSASDDDFAALPPAILLQTNEQATNGGGAK